MILNLKQPALVYILGVPALCLFLTISYIALMPKQEHVVIVKEPQIIEKTKTNIEYREMPGIGYCQNGPIIDLNCGEKDLFSKEEIFSKNPWIGKIENIQEFERPAFIKTLSGTYKIKFRVRSDAYIHFWEWKSGNLHSGTIFEVMYNEP